MKDGKSALRLAKSLEEIRDAREAGQIDVGFGSRPFILCGLPIKRPSPGSLQHIRRNGRFTLRVVADPAFGLPFGQDRLLPLLISTMAMRAGSRVVRFDSAAELLEMAGFPLDGKSYRRLHGAFSRVFGCSVFFEANGQAGQMFDQARWHYFDRARLWFDDRAKRQAKFEGEDFTNEVVLSEPFWMELQKHPVPVDLAVMRAFKGSPGLLDFSLWLMWRVWVAKGQSVEIPLFGTHGLMSQLGVDGYDDRPRDFRRALGRWLDRVRVFWPGCSCAVAARGDGVDVLRIEAPVAWISGRGVWLR